MILDVVIGWLLLDVVIVALYSAWRRAAKKRIVSIPVPVQEEPEEESDPEQLLADRMASDPVGEDEHRVGLSGR